MSLPPMNDPASALDLSLDNVSEDELLQLIEELRAGRYSDIERTKAAKAKRTVTSARVAKAGGKAQLNLEDLVAMAGVDLPPEKLEKLKQMLAAKRAAKK